MIDKNELEEEIEILKQDAKKSIVVVEGIKDKKALEDLRIKHVMVLRKPLYLVCEHIQKSGKPCIILTDLDREGKRMYIILNHNLNQLGVHINNRFREFLFQTRLRQIEGITKYLKTIE